MESLAGWIVRKPKTVVFLEAEVWDFYRRICWPLRPAQMFHIVEKEVRTYNRENTKAIASSEISTSVYLKQKQNLSLVQPPEVSAKSRHAASSADIFLITVCSKLGEGWLLDKNGFEDI